YPEQLPVTSVQQASIQGKDPDQYRAKKTADAMNRNGTDGIVDLQPFVQKANGKDHDDSTNKANYKGSEGVHRPTTGGNAHQSGQGSVQGHGNIRLSVFVQGHQKGSNGPACRSQVGVDDDTAH